MSAEIEAVDPARPKRVAIVVSNPATSKQTGWPIGFWWGEVTHPYWEFMQHGYQVEIFSPDGGRLEADKMERSEGREQVLRRRLDQPRLHQVAGDLGVRGTSKPIADIDVKRFEAILFVGGQGPMYTFFNDERVHRLAVQFYEAGKILAVICHATCILLKLKLSNGKLLIEGKTWTGFANSEEQYADSYVDRRIQPFWIEEEARKMANTNFVVSGRFRSHAVRDGRLVTGQQQYSGAAAAKLVIEALGR